MFRIANFNEKGKFRMKCVGKYVASAEGASWKILDLLIDHRNLLWNIFLKFPWSFMNFPDFLTKLQISLTYSKIASLFPDLEFPWLFPDQWQPWIRNRWWAPC